MNRPLFRALAVLSLIGFAACSSPGVSPIPDSNSAPIVPRADNVASSCGTPAPGEVACLALFRTDLGGGSPGGYHGTFGGQAQTQSIGQSIVVPGGYGPAALQSAYKLPAKGAGFGQTVAIVDAYDDPNAERDLGVYRAQFGLPACTTANHCFKKINQYGIQGSYPSANGGWAQEISLDLDMVSAICPNCRIILAEAKTPTFTDLGTAVDSTVNLGANVVSNSYGGTENASSNAAYDHPGHVITASTGDSGTGPEQPASFSTVVAVGGTSLSPAVNARGWSESAWNRGGSGCSTRVAKPSWQHDLGCRMRTEADVSAEGDPNTGVAVYDSYVYHYASGWLVFGGTSASSPIVASVYALAGNAASQTAASRIWTDNGAHTFDVTSGSNGSCSIAYVCHAEIGYDGPTGRGSPNGVGAF